MSSTATGSFVWLQPDLVVVEVVIEQKDAGPNSGEDTPDTVQLVEKAAEGAGVESRQKIGDIFQEVEWVAQHH